MNPSKRHAYERQRNRSFLSKPEEAVMINRQGKEAVEEVQAIYRENLQALREALEAAQRKAKHNRYALMLFVMRLTAYRRLLHTATHHGEVSRADRMEYIRTNYAWNDDESALRICEGWPMLDQLWAATQHTLEFRGGLCSYKDLLVSFAPMLPQDKIPSPQTFNKWIARTRELVPDALLSRMDVFYQRRPKSEEE